MTYLLLLMFPIQIHPSIQPSSHPSVRPFIPPSIHLVLCSPLLAGRVASTPTAPNLSEPPGETDSISLGSPEQQQIGTKEIYYEESTRTVTEAEKAQDLWPTRWRPWLAGSGVLISA